ncbi:MAG: carbohydrate ABC transporter permease [Acidobacteria bacterium]|nr:MAG: carbohydrate ABC transporter permease [Acidobacteriota bacterium]
MERLSDWMTRIFLMLILIIVTLPIVLGYAWLLISTFSRRTFGLIPVNARGAFGGFTLQNWSFLKDPLIWQVTLNTLIFALGITVGVIVLSASAGYALSRMNFPGRRFTLTLTLLLHAFPSITLLLAIYFVLRWISALPVIGGLFGYNTLGGVTLVSIAMQLPLGIWLMKGFFDHVPWDMERAALIDGCSRFQAWWKVVMPQIRPGVFALAIFSFIQGWGYYSFLIPYSFMIDQTRGTISTYLNNMISTTSPVNYGQVAAVGLFQLIPVLLFFLLAQKYLLRIFSGGMKGTA